ncbi:MAG: hypothetical protein RR623_10095 [Bacilli bacterium]
MSRIVGLVFEEADDNKEKKALTAKECKDFLTEKGITFDEKAKVDELRKLVEENQ